MLLGKKYVLMNQAPGDGTPGGTNGNPPAPGTPPPPTPPQAPGTGTNPLDYYSQPPAPAAQPPAPPASQAVPPTPPAQPPAPPADVSGYGTPAQPPAPPANPPAPGTPPAPAAQPPANPPATPPEDQFKGLVTEGVDATYVESFKNFAKDNKLSPEQAQALLNLKKSEMAAYEAEVKTQQQQHQDKIKATRLAWSTELRNDPVFGGANFDNNVHLTNKYIAEFLPETNKHLTTNKNMLPPYVMRDLHRNAMEAYKTDTFVNGVEGDTTGGGDSYDPLDYYKQKQN